MKLFIHSSLVIAITLLQANEFPLLQPLSVEKSPLQHYVTQKKEPIITKKIQKDSKEKSTNAHTDAMLLEVKFQDSSTNFKENSIQVLEEFSSYLLQNKTYQVVIYAYTDTSGDKGNNLLLSQKRAKRVVKILENLGVSSTRLTAIGMGEKNPIADNTSREGRAKNRRIEALVIK